jgi:two-component system, chemotaxis family, CheB/CheR fusion protein
MALVRPRERPQALLPLRVRALRRAGKWLYDSASFGLEEQAVAGGIQAGQNDPSPQKKARSSDIRMVKSPSSHLPGHPAKPAGNGTFPIIGIGASAGGLEALEQFFSHVPENSGMAFVVIQHLDPTRKGMMPELLRRVTAMEVMQAKNRTKVKPDCIYVIPPNRDLSVLHGTLHLLDPIAPRGLHLPIDHFFRALAEDQRERSIGVILSGMGSDGTLGLRAIKENAGLALVQTPETAKFDSMPRNAIDAGLADIVAAAQDMPEKIIDFVRQAPAGRIATEPESAAQKGALDKIFILLRSRTGHDFSQYKKSTIYRRVERRMALHQLSKIADYARFLRENLQEIDLLFKELLIGVTSFFRDPATWACLQERALPELVAACPNNSTLRAWVAGCSTGEEAYSLAIAFREVMEKVKPRAGITLQIFATDLDPDAIDKARQGCYPANIAADVSAERLARFFVEEGSGYRVGAEIRETLVFAPQNVIMDPPFTNLDILTCRNLLIYLGPELQKKLLPLFHYCLKPGGILFLGTAETIGGFAELYSPLEAKARLYQRSASLARAGQLEFPGRLFTDQPAGESEVKTTSGVINLQALADQLLLQQFSPAAVLVNSMGDILYISGRTGKYLEPASGKANWNIHAMAREGLRDELALALPQALRDTTTVVQPGIRLGSDREACTIDLTVHAIEQPEALRGMAMVVFHELPASGGAPESGEHASARGRSAEAERVLRQARAEMQTQQEELKSTNEELQSTNEELQSTNEELTISKEEMQSLNEELQTVNAELQSKVDDLSIVNNDMKNLLNSTEIAIVFLDNQLHVRRFTEQATKIFKLISGDVGRPLGDIVNEMDYPTLQADVEEVLRTLVFSEKQVATHENHWFRVRIMPYRTLDNMIDGVVITFTDITESKRLEAELRQAHAGRNIADAAP